MPRQRLVLLALVIVVIGMACAGCSDGDEPSARPEIDQPDGSPADSSTPPRVPPMQSQPDAARPDAARPDAGAQTDAAPPVQTDAGQDSGAVTCAGADCLVPCTGDDCLAELPPLENLVARVRGDTLLVDFSAVAGARDYRIYPYPESGSLLVADDGSVAVRDATYRCSGDRPRPRRDRDGINLLAISLEGMIHGYMRKEADALLGYVFLTAGSGREPVYRLGDPNRNGGYTWPYAAPPGIDYTASDYAVGTAARDALLAKGLRDDGIAFYVPRDAARKVYRAEQDSNDAVLYYVDGPEAAARSGGVERFRVLAAKTEGAVPLYRIFYASGADHDVLAAGEANRHRALNQGNVPLTTATWPGMRAKTTYVIEALDQGCPFPDGLIGAKAVSAADGLGTTAPTITLQDARDPETGEVFINGQHDSTARPRAIARAYVTAEPEPAPAMDWFVGFDQALAPFSAMYEDGNGVRIFHNDLLSVEFAAANVDFSYGTVLDQFVAGSSASYSLSARGADARIAASDYLHVTMSVDIASTSRRYPQVFITNAPLDPPSFEGPTRVITARLGPYTFEMLPPGDYQSILVQVFGPSPELQVQFCDQRGWGVSDQCPRANIYGFHAGSELSEWTAPWLPVPVLGEYVGLDRPVKFDVYASTEKVYVFVEDRPAGCAVLPAGRMPQGETTVVFGTAGYHIDVDEFVEREPAMHEFWHRRSANHVERKFDDLGIDSHVSSLPMAWDESVLPCGERFYD
jgi:hypothetical protein